MTWVPFLALLSSLVMSARIIQNHQQEPYMDEVFHITQTQQYCSYKFHPWNPLITTLPGLYFLGLIWSHLAGVFRLALAAFFQSFGPANVPECSVAVLRSLVLTVNVAFNFLAIKVVRLLHPTSTIDQAHLHGALAALLPVHAFFSSLYYTDVPSTFLVILAYYFSLRNLNLLSALAGAAAVFVRQTNIAWALFCPIAASLISSNDKTSELGPQGPPAKTPSRSAPLLLHAPYLVLLGAFICFVLVNNGVAVGDRAHHQLRLHLPQLLYCATFALACCSPLLLDRRTRDGLIHHVLASRWSMLLASFVLLTSAAVVAIGKFSIAHPYLLGDNRHYTFYLWRRVLVPLGASLAPAYALIIITLSYILQASGRRFLFQALLALTTAAAVVPSPLIELRYFILPTLLLLLHLRPHASRLTGSIHLALFMALQMSTAALFAYKPFIAPDGSVGRFMW